MTSTAIAAASLLREYAEELKRSHTIFSSGAWPEGESEAKAAYEKHIAIASALETTPAQCLHQIQEPAPVQTNEVTPIVVPDDMPSTDANTKYGESYGVDWVYAGKKPGPVLAAPAAVAVPDERAAFEDFMRRDTSGFTLERHEDGSYKEFEVATYWHFWQARAALAATPAADAPALSRACDLLSMAIGTLMGQRAKIGYTDNSPIASVVSEAVEFLRPWPEKMPVAAAAPVVLPETVPTPCRSMFATQREYADAMEQHRKNWAEVEAERALLATGGHEQAVDIAELVTGMSVSVDVSTGDDDAGNRYFGTVTVAQEDPHDKHGLTLLVQDAKPNFAPQAQEDARDAESDYQRGYRHGYNRRDAEVQGALL